MTLRDDRLAASRNRFEHRWRDAQNAMQREVGVAPRRRGWVLLLFAAAAGLSLGMGGRRLIGSAEDDTADRPMPYDLDAF